MQWLEELWEDIQKWWKKQKPKKPHKVTDIRSFVMAKDVTLTWVLPIKRTGGGELLVSEILETRIGMSADGGANYTPLPPVLPTNPQEKFLPELDPGDWHFQFNVVDILGQVGPPAPWVETVVDDSPPDVVTNIQSTQT